MNCIQTRSQTNQSVHSFRQFRMKGNKNEMLSIFIFYWINCCLNVYFIGFKLYKLRKNKCKRSWKPILVKNTFNFVINCRLFWIADHRLLTRNWLFDEWPMKNKIEFCIFIVTSASFVIEWSWYFRRWRKVQCFWSFCRSLGLSPDIIANQYCTYLSRL